MLSIVLHTCVINFILFQSSFPNYASGDVITSAENEIYHRSSWKSDFYTTPKNRSKRSLYERMPSRLAISVNCGTDNLVHLAWRKIKQFLANEYLLISMSMVDSAMNQNVMNDIGEFVMYRDLTKFSSVVYFENWNVFYGVIGLDCYINALPYHFDDVGGYYRLGTIGSPYVEKYPVAPVHLPNVAPIPIPDLSARGNFPHSVDDPGPSIRIPSDAEPGPSNKRPRIERSIDEDKELDPTDGANNVSHVRKRRNWNYENNYYLETLVFVTKDLIEHFRTFFNNDCIAWIIRDIIIYLNAVDMTMAKLPHYYNPHVHINIAKIVIQDGKYPGDPINDNRLEFTETVGKYRQFLYINQNIYTLDSYDYVMILTSRQIWDQSRVVEGLTQYGGDMYTARKQHQASQTVPITMIQYKNYFKYPIATQEIAQIFGVRMDSYEEGGNPIRQCNSIMQRGGAKCNKCLQWSKENKKQFEEFLAINPNRCMLKNKPRSLLPPGPHQLVSQNIQCKCFGYNFHAGYNLDYPARYVPQHSCGAPLRCGKKTEGRMYIEEIILPFDGTSCGNKKVCWEGQCVGSL